MKRSIIIEFNGKSRQKHDKNLPTEWKFLQKKKQGQNIVEIQKTWTVRIKVMSPDWKLTIWLRLFEMDQVYLFPKNKLSSNCVWVCLCVFVHIILL